MGAALAFEKTDAWLERHDKSVIRAFTIVLAISTIGLWLATNKLWAAGEKQFGLLSRTAVAQSRDMQASIEAANQNAAMAGYAAEAAYQSNKIAKATAERTLRAYVVVRYNDIHDQKGPDDKFVFHIEVRNTGQTPAYRLQVVSRVTILNHPLPRGWTLPFRYCPTPAASCWDRMKREIKIAPPTPPFLKKQWWK